MSVAAMGMVVPWKIAEDFQTFVKSKNHETSSVTLNICILQENEFKELNLVLFESLFLGLYILFYTIFGHTNTEAQQSDELAPQNVQMTLKV